ncbi:putative E3 ubiquitin-protein ligase BOI [Helianthus annuus]|nr:putative E3 ubiquitin-protein ligase BOI [Helianthus annuus]
MAVQAQFFSDPPYQNFYYNNNNNNMGFSQDWPFMSGFGDHNNKPISSSSLSQYQQQYQQQDQTFQDSQKIMNSHHNLVSSSISRMNGFQGLSSELERQRLEMDYFLHFQNEKLKAVLNEETRKREMIMMHNYESKMKAILDTKEEALNTAKMRTKELQNYLSMAEKEANNWERKAMETEVMMTELHTKLKQARARSHEDAESVCGGGNDDHEEEEEQERQKRMVCKVCHVRRSCVLMLPCRHLCCCSGCEGLLMFCPVCESVKNGSLEVFFGLGG